MLNRHIVQFLTVAALASAVVVGVKAQEDIPIEEDGFDSSGISNCVIEPNDVVELSSRVDGILEVIHAERGDWVQAGGVVAELESGVEKAALAHASARAAITSEILSNKASLKYGQLTLKRVNELGEKQVISADEIDRVASETEIAAHRLQQAHDTKRLAELEMARAREVLKRHTIVSPIDGVVAERYLSTGESVEEQPIYRIAQIDPLRVEVVLPSSRYGMIRKSDMAKVHIQGISGGEFDAEVIIVDPIIDAASGTFRVTLELPNPQKKLTSGLRCEVSFLDEHKGLAASFEDKAAKQADPDEVPLP